MRREIFFLGQLPHDARFMDGLGQRLLAEAMLAHLHRANRGFTVIIDRA